MRDLCAAKLPDPPIVSRSSTAIAQMDEQATVAGASVEILRYADSTQNDKMPPLPRHPERSEGSRADKLVAQS